jgi:hypothetical protein
MGLDAKSYEEFWPLYLREHSRPLTRGLHITGTLSALALLGLGLASLDWRLLVVAPIVGYGLAWIGHFFVEHNVPATMSHPGWSLASDFRMVWLFVTGRLGRELDRRSLDPSSD